MSTPIRRIRSRCCARTASGHAAAALPSKVTNSRRFIGPTHANDRTLPHHVISSVLCVTAILTANVADGSKPVRLRASTCFPVYPQQRTFVGAVDTSVQGHGTHALQQV